MRYRKDNVIEIPLRLRDRRGRDVRASECDGLRIEVWTQSPRESLAFHGRDVTEDHGRDILAVSKFEMAALEPGVVTYRYTFRLDGMECEGREVTGIKWKDEMTEPGCGDFGHGFGHFHQGDRGVFQMVAKLKDDMDQLETSLSRNLRDLRRYVETAFPDELRKAENAIWKALGPLAKDLNSLRERFQDFVKSSGEDSEARQKEIEERLDSLAKKAKERLGALKVLIDENASDISALKKKATELKGDQAAMKQRIKEAVRRLDILEAGEDTVGSLARVLRDSKIYTDGKVDELRSSIKGIAIPEVRSWFEK